MQSLNDPHATFDHHVFSPTILREYDIRGQIGKNLSKKDAYTLGLAFGTYLLRDLGTNPRDARVCIGYDGRISSPGLAEALIKGLTETGVACENVGLGPSPMLYFATKDSGAAAGIMVTGSHNPADYNGFKMMLASGPVFGDQIQRLGEIARSGDYESGEGAASQIDVREDYIARLLQDFTGRRDLKVAWDAGNGAAGEIMRRLCEKLPGEHILLFDEIDGNFPNHHPDPTVDKNLIDLQKAVRDNGCDLGIAFDGDGDRIGVVDENGSVLRCDILMTIYAQEVLETHPGAAIIGDVKCSQVMFDEINALGGQAIMWKTGHSLIKDKMLDMNSPLAGELSGHIFFADKYYGFDDALYCAIRLLNAVDAAQGPLSSLTQNLPKLFNTPEVRVDVDEEHKFGVVPQIIENLKPALPDDHSLDDIDGMRVSSPDGWWLLRPSNTQAVLVFRAESHSEAGLERLKTMAKNEVEKLGFQLNFDH
ncbi:MAG: phosphomannomutase/phosphoglucomutase [Rhodospirillales bacterium]|nr:phosphomannomutase/phosphoglucomutase [Alphaproteobacteria bacterium]USO04717.1 MAG: phosphomannomutase/phosphoglucomutase [Rhodospirillales bacterium]